MYGANASSLLLFLNLSICCIAALSNQPLNVISPKSLCKGDTCHVSPDNFWQLQEIICSNQLIELTGGEFSVNDTNGSIVIENVSNLMISGRESLIECSPQSTFGLTLKNSINITLTGIRIRNCGFLPAPDPLLVWPLKMGDDTTKLSSFFGITKTSILIETSTVLLSGIFIEFSPGHGLTVIDTPHSGKPNFSILYNFNNHPNLTLVDSSISHSREISILIKGVTSFLIERTVLSNSSTGCIDSKFAVVTMMLKNVDVVNCGINTLHYGHVMVRDRLMINTSELHLYSLDLHMTDSKVLFSSSRLYSDRVDLLAKNSGMLFTLSSHMDITYSNLNLNSFTLTFTNITAEETGLFNIENCNIDIVNRSSLIITNNSGEKNIRDRVYRCRMRTTHDSILSVTNNTGISVMFGSMNGSLGGAALIANNSARFDVGGLYIESSRVEFHGSLEVVGNIGGASGITAVNSDLYFTGKADFSDNYATNGGALTLISSLIYLSQTTTVDFSRNHAQWLGGAIYISKHKEESTCQVNCALCTIRSQRTPNNNRCLFFLPTFSQNTAGIAGNVIYGGRISACMPSDEDMYCDRCLYLLTHARVKSSSNVSDFTSDPTRVCFCENGIPDCYKIVNNITVHPGENFNISLAIVGYGLGTVPGSVIARGDRGGGSIPEQTLFGSELELSQEIKGTECEDVRYSIVSERNGEQIALAVDIQSFVIPLEEVKEVLDYLLGATSHSPSTFYIDIYEEFFHIPVFVEVDLLACPIGFQLVRGRCVCHQILLDNNIDTCFFSNGTGFILRPAPFWIGLSSDINISLLIHPQCPLDYCQSEDINITAESPNTQCQYQRSGVLCGSCREGLSMILGFSECRTCSNIYLLSTIVLILLGVALVIILTLLNMTVSVGTMNGLILFANILQANRTTFLPPTASMTSAFLSVFIAWLNLDLGIPMCFFDGLTTYVKTWLQFVFPLYILTLVGVMIIASNYSTQVTRLLGTNAVSVLATLVLLSYTKILRILITAFSFTTLTGTQDYHRVVWLADGNIEYFDLKHAILFLVALLVLLVFGVPYTVTLTAAPWIQRSPFKCFSSLYNRFKPLFDAYMGPYKDRHRYWTGMLLLVRVVLIVLFSSISNTNTVAGPQLNLLLLSLSSFILFGFTAVLKPYKSKLLNGLEIFHVSILFIFSSSNLYVSSIGAGIGACVYIYIVLVGICFLVFLGICVGHIWHRVRKAKNGRRPEAPEREDEWSPLWWRVRVRDEEGEDEEREEVKVPTTVRRDSLVELIADLPQ